jgi:sugar phosphate isomerase/epimerase
MIDSDEGEWNKQKDALNRIRHEEGVYFSAHAPYIGIETDIASGDEVVRRSAVDYLRGYVIRAADIGAEIVTVHPGYVDFDSNGVGAFDFAQLTRSLDSLAAVAADYGVEVLLENTGQDREKYIVLSDEQHAYLCDGCGIGLTLDLVHFHSFHYRLGMEAYQGRLKSILPNVRNAHFNDVLNGEHVHLPLMKGNFNFHQVIKFMQEEGYQGNFIIEESGGGFAPESFVDAGREYIERLNADRVF